MQEIPLSQLPDNFGGLEEKFTKFGKSRVVILPIPLEKTTSYIRGTENGPRAIIEASKRLEHYDQEYDCEPSLVGIYTDFTLEKANFSLTELDESLRMIEDKIASLVERNKFVVSLGGEHSITPGIIKGFAKALKDDFTVVQFDAHADLRDKYEGEKFSHACVMRRIIEDKRIVQVGIRSLSEEEASFIKSRRLKIHWAGQKIDPAFINLLIKEIKTENIYITFDFDFLDPSIMPAVGTPEPGGYNWEDANYLLSSLIKRKNLVGIDFNELSPLTNGPCHPDFLAAKLIYKTIAYKFFDLPKKK